MSINNNTRKTLEEIIKDFDVNQFTQFFRGKNRSFAPRREKLNQYDDENFNNGLKLGEIKFNGTDELLFCAFEVKQQLTERSGKKAQYEKAKKILRETQSDAGIFIFYDCDGNFRFSLIYANYLGRRRDWSNFRRFTYFASNELTNKTFLQRIGDGDFSTLEKIKDEFSVEKVTKEFYKDIANWYFLAIQKTKFPKDAESEENGRNIAIIRLITRIIFIWFMRQRKLIPAKLFDYGELKQILKDLSPNKTTYYKAILQNLFFAILNTKKRKYRFQVTGWKNSSYMDHSVYRYKDYFVDSTKTLKIFKEIPFLNGGLFDCLDKKEKKDGKNVEVRIDGFSDKDVGLKFPNKLFFDEEIIADLSKELGPKYKKCKVHGLINILSAYNFTIDENNPNDQEVALDPELLGKVFENLLASFNPETSSTARKATGSYYTPREIVDYIVSQSLKEYFKTHLTDTDNINDNLEILFSSDKQGNPFSTKETKLLVKLIDELRIVDPAVGSGAFPMVILNKLVFILSKLDPESNIWKETQMSAVEKSITDPVLKNKLKEHVAYQFKEKNFDYGRKLYLIQKCIYGVDIQQIAVEIAKLRFFIALLVDEKIDKSKDNWDIEPLPNLDFKIMQGNSLISEFMGINFDKDSDENKSGLFEDETDLLIKTFQDKKNDFQNEPDKKKKDRLREEIDNLIVQIFESKLRKQKANYFNKLKSIDEKYSKLPNEKKRNELIDKEKNALYKKSGFNLEEVEKQLREFSGGNKTKPFFLWKLYFAEVFQGTNPGFDIVIGNPPYVEHKKLKGISSELKRYYLTYSGTADLYVYFYEKGLKTLKENGVLIFITSNKFIKTSYGENLRKLFLNFRINEIIDFSKVHIFEALVSSCIFCVTLKNTTDNKIKIAYANDSLIDFYNISKYIDNNKYYIFQNKLSENIWQLENETTIALKEKIENGSIRIKETGSINIYRGVTTGYNPAFIIDEKTSRELIKKEKDNKSLLKPLLQGRDIKKWFYQKSIKYLIFIPWHFPLHNNSVITGASKKAEVEFQRQYPSIYNYLIKFKQKLKNRNKDETGTRYEWYALQRCAATYYPEFEKEKIIWGLTADKWVFAYDNQRHYLPSNGYILTSEKIPIKYLIALLNSELMEFYFGFIGIMTAGGAFTLKHETIDEFPIKLIDQKEQQPFIILVDQILAITKTKDYLSNQEKQDKVKELEKEIDELVYKLYGLSEEEIKIVEGKT